MPASSTPDEPVAAGPPAPAGRPPWRLRLSPSTVAVAYLVVGSGWIIGSDLVVAGPGTPAGDWPGRQTAKGLVFVLLTSVVILLLLRAWERRLLAESERRAGTDDLTGLPTRPRFAASAAEVLGRSRDAARFGVCLIDVDRFSHLNDALGHAAGDEVLRVLGDRLRAQAGVGPVARFGGDRFVALLAGDHPADLGDRASHLLRSLARPVEVGHERYAISATAGLARAVGTSDPDLLMRWAAVALLHAKRAAPGTVWAYSEHMSVATARFVSTQRRLDEALTSGGVTVHYQPEVDLRTGTVVGVEALLRVEDRRGLSLPTAEVVAVAEETGRIGEVGREVLHQAAVAATRWADAGLLPAGARVWVNTSARQLLAAGWVEEIVAVLADVGCPAGMIGIEVTESLAVQESVLQSGALTALRARGLALAIDDFGTGHSSLAALSRLEVDLLKVDRSLVSTMAGHPAATAIVRAVAQIARELELQLVAEGIERPEEARALLALGCPNGQGHLMARPVRQEEATAVLRRAGSGAGPWW